MPFINAEVGQRLLALRKERGLKKAEVYRPLNFKRHHYDAMENRGCIRTDEIPLLCEFFGVTPDYLVDGKKSPASTRLHDTNAIFATHEHRIISDEEMKIIHRVDDLSDASKKLLNDNLDKNENFFNDEDIKILNDIYSLDKNNKEFLIEFLNKLKK